MAGVGDEQNARAALLEPLEEVIELGPDDALARAGRGGGEIREQEHGVHAVRLRSLDPLRLLRAMARDRDHHQVAARGALNQRFDRADHRIATGLLVDQDRHVIDAAAAQRAFDVARIRHGALQRTHVPIGIDPDQQRADLAFLRGAQRDRLRRHRRCGDQSSGQPEQSEAMPDVLAVHARTCSIIRAATQPGG